MGLSGMPPTPAGSPFGPGCDERGAKRERRRSLPDDDDRAWGVADDVAGHDAEEHLAEAVVGVLADEHGAADSLARDPDELPATTSVPSGLAPRTAQAVTDVLDPTELLDVLPFGPSLALA